MLALQPSGADPPAATSDLTTVIDSLFADLRAAGPPADGTAAEACAPAGGSEPLYPGNVVCTGAPVRLRFDRTAQKEQAALEKALLASAREAAANGQAASDLAAMPELASRDFSDEESPAEAQELTAHVRRLVRTVHVPPSVARKPCTQT